MTHQSSSLLAKPGTAPQRRKVRLLPYHENAGWLEELSGVLSIYYCAHALLGWIPTSIFGADPVVYVAPLVISFGLVMLISFLNMFREASGRGSSQSTNVGCLALIIGTGGYLLILLIFALAKPLVHG